jgi:hypothetical protein
MKANEIEENENIKMAKEANQSKISRMKSKWK